MPDAPRTPAPAAPGTPWGIYVHLPWCRQRCPYCSFTISLRREPPHAAYTAALLAEAARRAPAFAALGPPSTLFFGGGTPSETPAEELARLVEALGPRAGGGEVSLELNPGGPPGELRRKLSAWRRAGVTRVSVGVQSFDEEVLARLGRDHDGRAARAAVEEAMDLGFEVVSLDLIFAVPGEPEGRLVRDLAVVASLGVAHVSLYGLTVEKGTPFSARRVREVDEDRWRAEYDALVGGLEARGIERYEVSNFARPGSRCRHNEHYWRARPWMGLGVGAHGWLPDRTRTVNTPSVVAYLAGERGTDELPEGRVLAAEWIGSTIRHRDGLDRGALTTATGLAVATPPALLAAGLLVEDGPHLRLTDAGFPVADAVAARLCAGLRPPRAP